MVASFLFVAAAEAVSYLEANPRAALRQRAVAMVESIGAATALADPPWLVAADWDWVGLPEDLVPSLGEREDEARRARASVGALATVARALRRDPRVGGAGVDSMGGGGSPFPLALLRRGRGLCASSLFFMR